jgi:poly-gamma-glutamate biosynthesis protein PgsC/CapC
MLHSAVGLSIILGFAGTELLGILSGGLVSAGYLAFFFEQPLRIAMTLALSVLICLLVNFLQRFLILFGRRRFVLTVLISLAAAWAIERSFFLLSDVRQDLRIIGYVIPGLIANDMEKQGILKTIAMLMIIAVIIRLVMLSGIL